MLDRLSSRVFRIDVSVSWVLMSIGFPFVMLLCNENIKIRSNSLFFGE